jgi:hypothetical protein
MEHGKNLLASFLVAGATTNMAPACGYTASNNELLIAQGYGWQSQPGGTADSALPFIAQSSGPSLGQTGTTSSSQPGSTQPGAMLYAQMQQQMQAAQPATDQAAAGSAAGSQTLAPGYAGYGTTPPSVSGNGTATLAPTDATAAGGMSAGIPSGAMPSGAMPAPMQPSADIPAGSIASPSILEPPGENAPPSRGFAKGPAQRRPLTKGTADDAADEQGSAPEPEPPRLDTPMHRAVAYLHGRDYAGCLAELDQVLRTSPNNAQAHYMKGVVYVLTRHFSQAAQEYRKAVDISPDSDVGKLARNGLSKLVQ